MGRHIIGGATIVLLTMMEKIEEKKSTGERQMRMDYPSSLDTHGRVDDLIPTAFAWTSFMLAMIGLKNFRSFLKLVWGLQEPLMQACRHCAVQTTAAEALPATQ